MSTPPDSSSHNDDATPTMFATDEMGAKSEGYQVLARKYRPQRFDDLIGQEAMVHTLRNAFATGRIAHAFMLTGVRGVGKTTTARLLARALNYDDEAVNAPSMALTDIGSHCADILAGRHADVLELDAASRTGVADMREILDSVSYAPVMSRYKVYIIDEVHMLSNHAFNALLKTLEEPPAHVKFIFATTEIRKVPVTILSRCQRFDLKRVPVDLLSEHLQSICKKEGAKITLDGLMLIARAAEGSVRDSLSLLDQAIVQNINAEEIDAEQVRAMIGMADRQRLHKLLELTISGQKDQLLQELDSQIAQGAEPQIILKELLEVLAEMARAQALADQYRLVGPVEWLEQIKHLANMVSPAQLSYAWRLILIGYQDCQSAPDPVTCVQMVLLRLAAAMDLPSPEDASRMLSQAQTSDPTTNPSTPSGTLPNTPRVPTDTQSVMDIETSPRQLLSFDMLREWLEDARQASLLFEYEHYVKPGKIEQGILHCQLKPNIPHGFTDRLRTFLGKQTGLDWVISHIETDQPTPVEALQITKETLMLEAEQDPAIRDILQNFKGAQLVDVEPIKGYSDIDTDIVEDNVIALDFSASTRNARV